MANSLQVSRSSVGRWENLDDPDHRIVKRPFVEAWARRCNVPFEWLWSGTSNDFGSSWPGAEVLQLAV